MWALCCTKETGLHPLPADDAMAKNRQDLNRGKIPQVAILLVGERSAILRALSDAMDAVKLRKAVKHV